MVFLFLWSIYTIASKGFMYLEGIKEQKEKTVAEDRAEKRKALKELAHTVTGGVFLPADQRDLEPSVIDQASEGLSQSLERLNSRRERNTDQRTSSREGSENRIQQSLNSLIESVKGALKGATSRGEERSPNRF
jgi:hypothetical protein